MIDQYPPANGVLTSLIWRKTMSGGETSLSGYDNASQALSYTPGQEQVYLNGILLVRGDDYTATNGTSITGLSALSASDFVQVNCYNNFSVASLPSTSITGEITNSQITSLATSKLTGTISNAQLAGSISNDKLANSSITINGSAVSLGGSTTIAGGSAQDDEPTSPTEGQLWLDTNGTLATTGFTEKATLTTTGDIYYASGASTPARLGIGSTDQVLKVSGGVPVWGAVPTVTPTFSGVMATGTSAQTISNTTETVLTFDSEVYDTDSYHSTSSNTSRLTVPAGKGGYYLITFMVQYAVNGTDGHRTVYIKKNGSTYLHGGASSRPSGVVFTAISYTMIHNLVAGDYVELATYQSSGGSLNVIKATNPPDTYFTMQYLGA